MDLYLLVTELYGYKTELREFPQVSKTEWVEKHRNKAWRNQNYSK